jgi:hypothetical protein
MPMSAEDDTKRPLPSAAEINAYLELSAARTKKRLPLAFGAKGSPKAAARERKLPVAGASKAGPAAEQSTLAEPAADATEPGKPKPSGG